MKVYESGLRGADFGPMNFRKEYSKSRAGFGDVVSTQVEAGPVQTFDINSIREQYKNSLAEIKNQLTQVLLSKYKALAEVNFQRLRYIQLRFKIQMEAMKTWNEFVQTMPELIQYENIGGNTWSLIWGQIIMCPHSLQDLRSGSISNVLTDYPPDSPTFKSGRAYNGGATIYMSHQTRSGFSIDDFKNRYVEAMASSYGVKNSLIQPAIAEFFKPDLESGMVKYFTIAEKFFRAVTPYFEEMYQIEMHGSNTAFLIANADSMYEQLKVTLRDFVAQFAQYSNFITEIKSYEDVLKDVDANANQLLEASLAPTPVVEVAPVQAVAPIDINVPLTQDVAAQITGGKISPMMLAAGAVLLYMITRKK